MMFPGRADARYAKAAEIRGAFPVEPFLSVADTARILKCCETTVRRLIDRHELGHVRVGRSLRVRHADIERYIFSHSDGSADAK